MLRKRYERCYSGRETKELLNNINLFRFYFKQNFFSHLSLLFTTFHHFSPSPTTSHHLSPSTHPPTPPPTLLHYFPPPSTTSHHLSPSFTTSHHLSPPLTTSHHPFSPPPLSSHHDRGQKSLQQAQLFLPRSVSPVGPPSGQTAGEDHTRLQGQTGYFKWHLW